MSRSIDFSRGLPLTPIIKRLIILNVGIWFIGQLILENYVLRNDAISGVLSLTPSQVVFKGAVWQLFTYMFLHTQQLTHILFNMLMLWFFGAELETRWGSRFFLLYYLASGVGAAMIYTFGTALAAALWGVGTANLDIPVMGASGAVFGLLVAYGMMFGDREIYFMMLFPMKAKFFVMIMGFVELASMISSHERGSEVAYLAHLGVLIAGYLFLKIYSWWQRQRWNRKLNQKHKGRNLRLVVDNDRPDDQKGPRYWN